MNYPPLEVKVWGDYACFTRPEMKVERVTYPVMTPSAARGILEAIFWKPEFAWRVVEIGVLNEIRYDSILRNEVNDKMSKQTAQNGYFADLSKNRAQRHSLILREVAYIIKAEVKVKPGVNENPAQFRDQFRRRVNRGQCFHTPYLGCREFSASFGKVEEMDTPIGISMGLGLMLLDLKYEKGKSGRGSPMFFKADIVEGILHIPQDKYGGLL